ncbi:MAG: class I SAM-dependent methyltransferase [Sphingomonadales bacterium]|nr:class I SAM-dependent methyltransferase [Sphingomonadales bacterium]
MALTVCPACGGTEFRENSVLWPELVAEWQITSAETAYIDKQQGFACTACGTNLRAMALADALRSFAQTTADLGTAIAAGALGACRVLDINGIPGLSGVLARLPGYEYRQYPDVDLHQLPYEAGQFDIVIHSDTIEHVEYPVRALEECRRVLRPGGRLFFTAPIIVARMSRSRAGLPPSYHGDPTTDSGDLLVRSEFGADIWTQVMQAGFGMVALNQLHYPAGIAISAWDPPAAPAPVAPPQAAVEEVQATPVPEAIAVSSEADPFVPEVYDQDGLRSVHNHEFMGDPFFRAAYGRGVVAAGADYNWHWRVHVGLWAAQIAIRLPGDFVECGVNRGFLSSAIMQALDWNATGRTFYLLDTFTGIDPRFVSSDDIEIGVMERNDREIASGFYTQDISPIIANFAEWPTARIIAGAVPETLDQIDAERIAFLHLDMNCSPPEVAAIEALWDRLVPGAPILLDDYAYWGYRSQKLAMDAFAAPRGVAVLSLPTGQGLIIKPAQG